MVGKGAAVGADDAGSCTFLGHEVDVLDGQGLGVVLVTVAVNRHHAGVGMTIALDGQIRTSLLGDGDVFLDIRDQLQGHAAGIFFGNGVQSILQRGVGVEGAAVPSQDGNVLVLGKGADDRAACINGHGGIADVVADSDGGVTLLVVSGDGAASDGDGGAGSDIGAVIVHLDGSVVLGLGLVHADQGGIDHVDHHVAAPDVQGDAAVQAALGDGDRRTISGRGQVHRVAGIVGFIRDVDVGQGQLTVGRVEADAALAVGSGELDRQVADGQFHACGGAGHIDGAAGTGVGQGLAVAVDADRAGDGDDGAGLDVSRQLDAGDGLVRQSCNQSVVCSDLGDGGIVVLVEVDGGDIVLVGVDGGAIVLVRNVFGYDGSVVCHGFLCEYADRHVRYDHQDRHDQA